MAGPALLLDRDSQLVTPRSQLYNSKLEFRKRQGANKALCDLAPMRGILFAARDIMAG